MTTQRVTDDILDKVEQAITGAVSTTIRRHFAGFLSEYAVYKQTHDAILSLPAVKTAILNGSRDGNGNDNWVDDAAHDADTNEAQSQD